MSSSRSTRSSAGSLKRSSLSLHNEEYDDDDNEAEQREEVRSDSKRRRYTQPEEDGDGEDGGSDHRAPQPNIRNGAYSHSQPAPNTNNHSASAADKGDDEIEFSYEHDDTATTGTQQQQAASRTQSSSQQSAANATAELADVELPEANRQWLEGYGVMRDESGSRQPLEPQDRQHRTQLRQMYGEVTQQSSTLTPEQLQDSEVLVRGVAMANKMNKRVSHVTEEIQDAETMRVLAGKGHDKARMFLQHDDIVNVDQMIAALHERFDVADGKEDHGAIDWVRMGELTMRISLNAPVTSFMRGVLNQHIAHKERKRSQRRQRDEDLVSSTATTLDSTEQLVDKQTHMRQLHVLRHFKRLTHNGTRAIWLYELLIDPNSFVRTVENFFDFSFLVKDNVRMEWMEWDAEMAFPMVRWRRSELERTRERRRMEKRLRRLKQRIAQRQEAVEDETAADAERREREDRQSLQLVSLLRSLNQLPSPQRHLAQSQAESAAAEQRRQAATDESEANMCHFTPTLDYHAWSSIVVKFGMKEAKIPPMTDEEERRMRERMDRRAKRKKGREAKEEEGEDGEEGAEKQVEQEEQDEEEEEANEEDE